jgi:hypothetical protein
MAREREKGIRKTVAEAAIHLKTASATAMPLSSVTLRVQLKT